MRAHRGPEFPCRLRLLRWLERAAGPKRLVAAVDGGLRLALDQRDIIQRALLLEETYEPEVVRHLRAALRPGDFFLDVGANTGFLSLVAAQAGAGVAAIEPDPLACRIIELNLSLNPRLQPVAVISCALADFSGTAQFGRSAVANTGLSGLGLENAVSRFSVAVRTLDSLVQAQELPPPSALKIDVEGAEMAVLAGARGLFEKAPPRWLVVELEAAEASRSGIEAWLRSYGYTVSRIERDSGVLEARENYLAVRG